MSSFIKNNDVDALIEAVKNLDADGRKTLIDKLSAVTMADVHAAAEKKRVDLMARAAADPAMEPTIRYVTGRLRAINCSIHDAADLGKLNKALDEARPRLPMDQRLAIKAGLASIGIWRSK